MSEPRKSITDIIVKTTGNRGKKSLKIELYPAGYFREHFDIWDRSNWHPKPSLQTVARQRYWKERFRIRVGGKWYGDKAKYQTYSIEEIFSKVVRRAIQ